MANRYSYKDPNAGNVVRTVVGDNYSIFALGFCQGGQAIKIFSGSTEVLYSCYLVGSLTIVPIVPPVDNNKPCDCLNGSCIPATTYGTPGAFATLAACQAVVLKTLTVRVSVSIQPKSPHSNKLQIIYAGDCAGE